MPADRHPNRWVGEAVYKQGEDGCGHEVQIKGVVMSYCPMSTKFLLLYSDGSSEAVPIDEIGDHVPLLRQLPDAKRRSKKRKTKDRIEERTESQEPSRVITAKRVKVVKKEPAEVTALTPPVSTSTSAAARPHVAPLASRFVQDMLWALTTTYNVSDAKQQALLATLDNRSEQPRAALARYIEEGGLDAMHQTLRDWACGAGETRDQSEDHGQKNGVKREPRPSPSNPVPYHAAADKSPTSPRPRSRSRCDQHLHDLLSAAKNKPADEPAKVAAPPAPPKSPELVDLTGDSDEDEEEDDGVQNARARRRLHFGRNSMVRFSVNGSVEDFRVQLKRSRQTKRPKMPKRSPKVQKVLLKRPLMG